ncbi:unnamed protein product [Calicophoron daubneyi]|uniref:DUF7041 domain-containing protein n=1 Tax=Calicophoron daubneyi TaxID=300641 RepID=A0AAV2T5P2_CALDB
MSGSEVKCDGEGDIRLSVVRSEDQRPFAPLSLCVPPFEHLDVGLWFLVFESQLDQHKIRQDGERYNVLLARLPAEVLKKIRDVIATQIPFCVASNTRYEVLKAAVTRAVVPSLKDRANELLKGPKLGDQTPSQLLNQMTSLAGPHISGDPLFRELWLQRLPTMAQAIFSAIPPQSLSEAAVIADNIVACTREPDSPFVAAYGPAPSAIVPQGAQSADRHIPRPILGQEFPGPSAVRTDTTDQSSMLHAMTAEIVAMRSDIQRLQQPRFSTAHQRPQPPNQSFRRPTFPQPSMGGVCWYHQ